MDRTERLQHKTNKTNLKTSLLCYVKESHSCLIQLQACCRIKVIHSLWVHQAQSASSAVCPAPSTVLPSYKQGETATETAARRKLSVAGGSCPSRRAAIQQDTSRFAFPSSESPDSSLHETSSKALAGTRA